MQEEQEGGKYHKELKLVNSGAFGCIYNPSMNCNGDIGSDRYITKIQKSDRTIKHELETSDKIRKIHGYARFFAPVLKSCDVRISKDRLKDLKKCEVFEKESVETIKETEYVSMKIRYVGDNDLKKHLFSKKNQSDFLNEVWKTHIHILKGIYKLFANKIVHYDLKYNNIILDNSKKTPIIIDFGQSWSVDKLETEKEISAAFFVFDQYDYWCIDILICNYIIQKIGFNDAKNIMVTEAEIDNIYDVFVYGREPKYEPNSENTKKLILNDAFRYGILHNPQKMYDFKGVIHEYINPFINKKTWWELYEDLLKCANTWDCYSIAIIYLNMLDDVFINNPNVYNNMLKISDGRLQRYVELMEMIVYSSPKNRPSIATVLKEIDNISK
jgi:hypothetical protein